MPLPKLLDDGANAVLRESTRLVEASSEPFFLFINLMDAHVPHHNVWGYDQSLHDVPNTWTSITGIDEWRVCLDGPDLHAEDVKKFRQLYAASIEYLDRKVSAFIDCIQDATENRTTFVITADHGENLGYPEDECLFEHKSSLSESVLHVPLSIVNPPEGYERYETEFMSQLELGTLLSGVARGDTPNVFAERVAAERIGTTIYGIEMDEDERVYWGRMLRCVYEDDTKIVWDSIGNRIEYELDQYRPCWQRELRRDVSIPSWRDQFFAKGITAYKASVADTDQLDEMVDEFTEERLRDLGYL